jgi:glycosyltransferase involved in cell wall biosynthesis
MLQGASIVCLSSIDWSFNWQIPQEVAQSFARAGNRVLFVENTGIRRAAMRDASRLWSRFRNWCSACGGVKGVAGGVDVLSPLLLPFPYSRGAVFMNTLVLVQAVRTWLGRGSGPLIIITFLPTPLSRSVINALSPTLVIYYCLDRLSESSPGALKVAHSERILLAEADLVMVTSGVLYEKAAEVTSRVELLASGVNVEKFESARMSRDEEHESFAALSKPIIGYIGSLRSATDLVLLECAADLAPDLQFLLAGPRFVDVTPLASRSNVRVLDAIPHEDAIAYMVRFDVGILPYSINQFTAGIMPVKLKEYLAAGLPVVATPLPEVRRFAEQHPGLVRFARDPVEFVATLRAALSDSAQEVKARRASVARQYDWSHQMARMHDFIKQAQERALGLTNQMRVASIASATPRNKHSDPEADC